MATVIWKFPIDISDDQPVDLPVEAKMLHVDAQRGAIYLWAQLNPEHEKTRRTVRIFGTGHPMPDDPGHYINTFIMAGGALVFHAYEAT